MMKRIQIMDVKFKLYYKTFKHNINLNVKAKSMVKVTKES